MKIVNNLIFKIVIFLIFHRAAGQIPVTEGVLRGIVLDNTDYSSIQDVNIVNINTGTRTKSDNKGEFFISARVNDIIVFSMINLEETQKVVTSADLKLTRNVVKMAQKYTKLNEVIVNKYPNITAEKLGIIPNGQKKYTAAQRKLYTANSTHLDAMLNAFSGRTDMLKKELIVEDKERLLLKLEFLIDNNFYLSELKIPSTDIRGFKIYCIEDHDFRRIIDSLNDSNTSMIKFLMTGLAEKYLKIIENEKI